MKVHYFFFFILFSFFFAKQQSFGQDFITAWSLSNNLHASGYDITTDASGNIYQCGTFGGTVDFDPGPAVVNRTAYNFLDAFVTKLDANGNLLWVKLLSGPNTEQAKAIAVDRFGNVIVSGHFRDSTDFDPGASVQYSLANGNDDVFLTKLDSLGNFLWAKTWGGSFNEDGVSLDFDYYGNVYVAGWFQDTVDFDPGPGVLNFISPGTQDDAYVSKFDDNGNLLWAAQFGGSGGSENANDLVVDQAGHVYITGKFGQSPDFDPGPGVFNLTTTLANELFVCHLDASGNFVWAKQFNSSIWGYGESITMDEDKNLYITGYYMGVADVDPGPAVYNYTSTLGTSDIFICRWDSSANFNWCKSIGGTSLDVSSSIEYLNGGKLYIGGGFFNTVDFDPGIDTAYLVSNGSQDMFIMEMDTAGNYQWAESFGGTSTDYLEALTTDPFCHLYSTGSFYNTIDFDPGVDTFDLIAPGSNVDAFVLKLDQCIGLDIIEEHLNECMLYPNPNHGLFNVEVENIQAEMEVEVMDMQGKIVYQNKLKDPSHLIVFELYNLECGLYTLRMKSGDKFLVKKFVIID